MNENTMVERTTVLPDGYIVVLELDPEYDPATSVDWSEEETATYVQEFRDGTRHAYGVRLLDDDELEVGSVWGCDSDGPDASGVYTTIADLPNAYLREIARDLVEEHEEEATENPAGLPFHGAELIASVPGHNVGVKLAIVVKHGDQYITAQANTLTDTTWYWGHYTSGTTDRDRAMALFWMLRIAGYIPESTPFTG